MDDIYMTGEELDDRMSTLLALAENRIEELEAQVSRLQGVLRNQDAWWWESVGEGQASCSDDQLIEQWDLHLSDLDPVKGGE